MLVTSTTVLAQTPQYTIKQIGPLPGHTGSFGNAINDSGQIAGWSNTTAAYRWSQGTLDAMPPLVSGLVTRAEGIAENGSVLGSAYTGVNSDHATIWSPSGSSYVATDLGVAPGDLFSLAIAMNAGLVVGFSDNGINVRPAAWTPPAQDPGNYTIEVLPMWGSDFIGVAYDINASGVVVGMSTSTVAHALRWTHGAGGWTVTKFTAFASNVPAEARGVNASGVVVGYSFDPVTGVQHAARWTTTSVADLGALQSGWQTVANDLNDTEDVVGTSGPGSYTTAWIRPISTGIMTELNACLPSASPWNLISATDINNSGQITGWGDVGGSTHAFLLTPITVNIAGPTPGIAGQSNTITVTGATPGGTVRFMFGIAGGETQISGCPSVNYDIDSAGAIGNTTSNASGNASFSFFARPTMAGQTFLFQAFDVSTCRVTNVTQVMF
jgi:probable HAF family extracellular repeat protein